MTRQPNFTEIFRKASPEHDPQSQAREVALEIVGPYLEMLPEDIVHLISGGVTAALIRNPEDNLKELMHQGWSSDVADLLIARIDSEIAFFDSKAMAGPFVAITGGAVSVGAGADLLGASMIGVGGAWGLINMQRRRSFDRQANTFGVKQALSKDLGMADGVMRFDRMEERMSKQVMTHVNARLAVFQRLRMIGATVKQLIALAAGADKEQVVEGLFKGIMRDTGVELEQLFQMRDQANQDIATMVREVRALVGGKILERSIRLSVPGSIGELKNNS